MLIFCLFFISSADLLPTVNQKLLWALKDYEWKKERKKKQECFWCFLSFSIITTNKTYWCCLTNWKYSEQEWLPQFMATCSLTKLIKLSLFFLPIYMLVGHWLWRGLPVASYSLLNLHSALSCPACKFELSGEEVKITSNSGAIRYSQIIKKHHFCNLAPHICIIEQKCVSTYNYVTNRTSTNQLMELDGGISHHNRGLE